MLTFIHCYLHISFDLESHRLIYVLKKRKKRERERVVNDARDVQIRNQVWSEVDFKSLNDAFSDSSCYLNVKELLQETILVNPGHISQYKYIPVIYHDSFLFFICLTFNHWTLRKQPSLFNHHTAGIVAQLTILNLYILVFNVSVLLFI